MSDNPEVLQDAGEVITEQIVITSRGRNIDIKALTVQTVIHEDIFSNMMTGYIVVQDAASFITQLPISGVEQLTISFRTPGFLRQKIRKTFYITSVNERMLGEKEQAYTLSFISVEALTDNVLRVSKKFSGKTDSIIKKIYEDYLKDKKNLVVNESHGTSLSVVSPYWSPIKLINWVANRSYQKAPSVLFFEGNKNFYLSSIEGLIRSAGDRVFETYSYVPTTLLDENRDFASRYKNISRITSINFMDVFRGQDFGYYSSRLVTHDVTTKQYREFAHDQFEYHKTVETLHNGGVSQLFPKNLPRNPDMFRRVRTKQYAMFDENKDPMYETWVMQRNSLLYEASILKFSIEVPGRTDMEVGKVIEIVIPKSVAKSQGDTAQDLLDPYLSGRYLVTSIRHEFMLNKHTMTMEVMKDSFKKPVN